MTLEMRELRGDDLFTLLAIVGKLDIKDEFVKMFERNMSETSNVVPMDHKTKEPTKAELAKIEKAKAKEEAETQKRGMEMMAGMLQKVLINLKSVKGEVNEMLAELASTNVTEIQGLGLKDYTSLVVGFFKKPELADFFGSIASLL